MFKITILLHSLHDINNKKYLKIYKKYDYEIINEFKYILSTQKVVITHNATY
jgi:hypothetical protein